MGTLGTASANPTRAFFVRMLTRDITLEDCILDLLDNSVDGAWSLEGGHPLTLEDKTDLSKYSIRIEIKSDRFVIHDNCGGISLDDAADYAFTFGRSDDADTDSFSIGIYGIGMKRAIFKIGRKINIRSTYQTEDGQIQSFRVPINVEKWVSGPNETNWDFDIEPDDPLDEPGVRIEIEYLTDGAEGEFSDPAFLNKLKRIVSRDYSLHLHRGLRVSIDEKPISGWAIELRQGGNFLPMRSSYKEEVSSTPVNVEILAGMAAPPPDDSEPSERLDSESRSGWYVICNGRVVVAADKTELTGWGSEGWPKWHPQYSGFIGILIFSAENALALPLTTTKRSVDTTQPLFRRALPKMRGASKEWINYTNARKSQIEQARALEEQAERVSIFDIPIRKETTLPQLTAKPREKVANILYNVPLNRARKLASAFGYVGMSYKEIGIKSFEYAYEDLVEDE